MNGAGLAMSTVDTIDLLQGKAANFLDAGGKATPETIKEAFRLVLNNKDVCPSSANLNPGESRPRQCIRRRHPGRYDCNRYLSRC